MNTLAWIIQQRKCKHTQTHTHIPLPTCAICFGNQEHGVENLILVLFIQDFALTEVGGELCRGDDATHIVAFAFHILPQRLHVVIYPRCPVFHHIHPEKQQNQQALLAVHYNKSMCSFCLSFCIHNWIKGMLTAREVSTMTYVRVCLWQCLLLRMDTVSHRTALHYGIVRLTVGWETGIFFSLHLFFL